VAGTTLLTYALALAAIIAIVAAFVGIRVLGPRRAPKRRTSVSHRSSAETIYRLSGSRESRPHTNGRAAAAGALLREKGGDNREFVLGTEPAVIGASATAATIVLNGDGIAPEHARIWLRQDKYLLHHVGGLSRKTYVSGQEADWVVLEAGDELTIGSHRLVFEDHRPAVRTIVAPVEEPVAVRDNSGADDDLSRMEAAVRELWAEALPASETAVGERSGTGKYKVHRRKDELAQRMGAQWVKRGRTVVLER
jgi:pSer/pThr/pTyr-binding forkhead associated (FHA) protein